MMYEVNYTDPETGATSPIDMVVSDDDYTVEQYIKDCEVYGEQEWVDMLHKGLVELKALV